MNFGCGGNLGARFWVRCKRFAKPCLVRALANLTRNFKRKLLRALRETLQRDELPCFANALANLIHLSFCVFGQMCLAKLRPCQTCVKCVNASLC